ncbi:MAG: nitric oxide synthase oxygenase [Bacteroidota bacterium]
MEHIQEHINTEHIWAEARDFLQQYYQENQLEGLAARLREVEAAIGLKGQYWHTAEELAFGAKLAWRNSNRCIGRLFWPTLKVLDYRRINSPQAFIQALEDHIALADGSRKIRNVISVFPPQAPGKRLPFRIFNYELIQYAGYQEADGQIIGDPKHLEFTARCQALGWRGAGTPFDLLPLVYQYEDQPVQFHEWPPELIQEIEIEHPEWSSFQSLQLKWYKLPMISNMRLSIGGIDYPTAPFNGWYMLNEIATRNFGDQQRYNLLPAVADKLGLDRSSPFWKDKALIALNEAVYHSFQKAGATIVDHHTACEQFMRFVAREQAEGREVTGDWSWLVPPNAGSTTEVFHQEWSNEVKCPYFFPPSDSKG